MAVTSYRIQCVLRTAHDDESIENRQHSTTGFLFIRRKIIEQHSWNYSKSKIYFQNDYWFFFNADNKILDQ